MSLSVKNSSEEQLLKYFALYDDKYPMASSTSGTADFWLNRSYIYSEEGDEIIGTKVKETPPLVDPLLVAKYLDIKATPAQMETAWKEMDVVMLRPYAGEKTLVIGCGNKPITFGSYIVVEKVLRDLSIKDKTDDSLVEHFRHHEHRNAYTINPDIGMNPSIVGLFGEFDTTLLFPDKCFSKIIFEGVYVEIDALFGNSTLPRILTNDGQVMTTDGRVINQRDFTTWTNMCMKFWKRCYDI